MGDSAPACVKVAPFQADCPSLSPRVYSGRMAARYYRRLKAFAAPNLFLSGQRRKRGSKKKQNSPPGSRGHETGHDVRTSNRFGSSLRFRDLTDGRCDHRDRLSLFMGDIAQRLDRTVYAYLFAKSN